MHIPGYAVFFIILGGILISAHLANQLFRWAIKTTETNALEEHPLNPLITESDTEAP